MIQGRKASHFSLHLENPTVGDILDELCVSDMRYTWSEDGATINIYPRATEDDESYLLNLRMDKIEVKNVPDPDQALTPLSKNFPEQQIGYFGPGLGSNTYVKPWTTSFENLTVRQFANRLAEQMGPETSWVWDGGKGQRFFTFIKGGFQNHWAHTKSEPKVEQ